MMPALTVGLKHLGGKPRIALSTKGENCAPRLLLGRTRAEAMRLVPLVFNLCPAAQSAAAAITLELPTDPEADLRIAIETLREHALVMLREWPVALERQPDIAAMTGLAKKFTPEHLDNLERVLFNGPSDLIPDNFEAWMSESGACVAADLATVARWAKAPGRVAFDSDPTFIGRIIHHRGLKRIIEAEGITLFARMAARAIETAALIREIRSDNIAIRHGSTQNGQGWAEAARGRLTHSARLRNGLIESYCIATPTDGMTGNGAFLETLLNSAATAPHTVRRQQMAIAMTCADPCMPVIWDEEAMHHA